MVKNAHVPVCLDQDLIMFSKCHLTLCCIVQVVLKICRTRNEAGICSSLILKLLELSPSDLNLMHYQGARYMDAFKLYSMFQKNETADASRKRL